jgi:hypothetical protein
VLRTEQLSAPPAITAAFAATTRATVGIIEELNRQIAELETGLAQHFETHPDADIYLSLPGLGVVLGARVLGEFGDLLQGQVERLKCRLGCGKTSMLFNRVKRFCRQIVGTVWAQPSQRYNFDGVDAHPLHIVEPTLGEPAFPD